MADTKLIASLTMSVMEQLESLLPDGGIVRAAGLVVEIEFDCPGCGVNHTATPVFSTADSRVHEEGLMLKGWECSGEEFVMHPPDGAEVEEEE